MYNNETITVIYKYYIVIDKSYGLLNTILQLHQCNSNKKQPQ
jgi:hypothetical protein